MVFLGSNTCRCPSSCRMSHRSLHDHHTLHLDSCRCRSVPHTDEVLPQNNLLGHSIRMSLSCGNIYCLTTGCQHIYHIWTGTRLQLFHKQVLDRHILEHSIHISCPYKTSCQCKVSRHIHHLWSCSSKQAQVSSLN